MGKGSDAVVDARLRVHGIANLRIGDNSIMPRIPVGHTMAATMVIAEKAADLMIGGIM
jgi:choline dehydrogenase